MTERYYSIGEVEYTLYEAASGDYCVTVGKYGEHGWEENSYNIGTREQALEFILSDYEEKADL